MFLILPLKMTLHNLLVFQLHVLFICSISLGMLKLGERAINAWLCVLAIAMNLFVTKQISLGPIDVTASDSIAGCYLLGLCLIQEHFGRKSARQHVIFAFSCAVAFLGLSWFHVWYQPNDFDVMHGIHKTALSCMPRLVIASLTSFLLIQVVDISVFQRLKDRFGGRFFVFRTFITLMISNILDTFIFTFLGLWGLIGNIWHVIWFSLAVKIMCAVVAPFYGALSKNIRWLRPSEIKE